MGSPKAALQIGGESLLRRVAARLRLAVPKVLVVGPPELSLLVPDLTILPDLHPGIGPLAGIETALRAATSELLAVVACDMPFVSPELVKGILQYALDHPDADVVALSGDRSSAEQLQPLHAVYRRSCLPAVTRHVASGNYALFQLFRDLRVQRFPPNMATELDPSGLSALNANSPQEWADALALASSALPPS